MNGLAMALAEAAAKQYLNSVLIAIEKGDQLPLQGEAVMQAADDYDDFWEAVPSLDVSKLSEEQAEAQMKALLKEITDRVVKRTPRDEALAVVFWNRLDSRIAKLSSQLREQIYA